MLVFLVPKSLQDMCTNTHIEMMKDLDIVNDVIKDQKLDKAERGLRILSAFRLIRRDQVRNILSESIPVKKERIQELLDRKISEVTEMKMREISNRMSDLDEEIDAQSMSGISIQPVDKKQSLLNHTEDGLDSISTCQESESINFEGL
jgi:hypothetical protein